ncbi:MAG: FliM/FliN family flagellar motor switch protein [Candidatus Solibacter sp.]|jgi:flagellar motor switch protein FliN/FliY
MTTPAELKHLFDVPLHFEAVLPGPALGVGELLALSEGDLIKTGRPAGETVEVFVGGSLIGFGELADANGRCAVRMVRFHPGSR